MIDVNLNTNTGKSLMYIIFATKVAVNNLINMMDAEKQKNASRLKEIQEQSVFFDMRYKRSKQFFNDPLQSKETPVIKRKQAQKLDSKLTLINNKKERISSYNTKVESYKNTALYKQLRRI